MYQLQMVSAKELNTGRISPLGDVRESAYLTSVYSALPTLDVSDMQLTHDWPHLGRPNVWHYSSVGSHSYSRTSLQCLGSTKPPLLALES